MGRMEGDVTEGSSDIMLLGERLAPIPLTTSITRGGVLAGMSHQEGLASLGTGEESYLALTSVGGDSPTRSAPLLRWINPLELVLTLFTLDAATKSMERESLDMGVMSMLEALDHAGGALRDVIVLAGRVLA